MKKVLTIVALAYTTAIVAQPTFEWAISQGGTSNDEGTSITTDANGNVYSIGYFEGTVDFDPGATTFNLTSNGGRDIYIQKLDPSGNLLWVKQMGGSSNDVGESITIDGNGNVYSTGYFRGTVDFDPGAGVASLTSTNILEDIFIQKLDPSGNFLWVKQLGGTSGDRGLCIDTDANGNVYSQGYFANTVDFDPGPGTTNLTPISGSAVYTLKLNALGNFLWAKSTDADVGGAKIVTDLVVDGVGNVFSTGRFRGTADFDPNSGTTNLTSNGPQWDIYILKWDPSGNFLWAGSMGGPDPELEAYVSLDGNGNVLITGLFEGTADLDPGPGVSSFISSGGDDAFIQKLDPTGNLLWVQHLSSSANIGEGNITTDANGNVFTCGSFEGTVDFDVGAGTSNLTANGFDGYILKLDPSGSLFWAEQTVEPIDLMTLDASDNIYTIGRFGGTVDFDPGAGTTNLTSNGVIDIYIQKFSQTCTPTSPVPDVSTLPDLTGSCSIASPTPPTATNNCGDVITGNTSTTFPITSQGTSTITWTYDDGNGNTSTQTQEVIIDDVTAPVADASSLVDLTDECEITSLTPPTATDNCAGAITGTHNATLPITSTTTINWTYDDGNGNTSTQTQEVIITSIDNNVTQNNDFSFTADANGYNYQWVDCNDNNAPIAGETSQTFEATANGSYAVVIDNGVCSVMSDCFDVTTLSLDENEINSVLIYPNPTSGPVNIESFSVIEEVVVYNAQGKVILTNKPKDKHEYQIELPKESGVYFVKVMNGGIPKVYKVVRNDY